LCTSQEPLHLAAEQQYRLMPLAVPPETNAFGARAFGAVALFDARVRAVDPRFVMDDESLALTIDICRRLDGLPLAIELAAARVAALGLRTVHDKLDTRFRLLTGGSRATLRRHQTLRAALEWSYQLLGDAEQTVFRRLGVFAGGFTMEMAQSVTRDAQLDEWEVLDHLSALVDKSLVIADTGDPPRYRLLESARAFAREQLAAGESADALRRHALAVREFIERVDGPNLDGELRTDQLGALLAPEFDNLRAAHAWAMAEGGDVETAVVLAAGASALEDFAVEAADWLVPLQQPVEGAAVNPAVAARYWRAMASTNVTLAGRVTRAQQAQASDLAQAQYKALGQPRRVFSSLVQLAIHRMALDLRAAGLQPDDAARVAWIQDFLEPQWQAARPTLPLHLHHYQDWAQALALRAATSAAGRSLRQAERRIKQWAGIPMRELRGFGRAEQAFFRGMSDGAAAGKPRWAELAETSGYADQSHLCRETRRITGFTPDELYRRIAEDEGFWSYRLWQ